MSASTTSREESSTSSSSTSTQERKNYTDTTRMALTAGLLKVVLLTGAAADKGETKTYLARIISSWKGGVDGSFLGGLTQVFLTQDMEQFLTRSEVAHTHYTDAKCISLMRGLLDTVLDLGEVIGVREAKAFVEQKIFLWRSEVDADFLEYLTEMVREEKLNNESF